MAPQEWNDDYQSGMLYVSIDPKCGLLEYFGQINPLEAIANKYGLEMLDLNANDEGALFKIPRGQERTLAEKLQGDKIIGGVEYVVDGVYNLMQKLDRLHMGEELQYEILFCSTKQEVNCLLKRYYRDIEWLKLS
jgi:hypothetical protein